MATVSIDADDVSRYVIRHRALSIAGGEPRHRVIAVFDNEAEWVETITRLHEDLDLRRSRGQDVEQVEDFTGLVLDPGVLTREPTGPMARRALQRGSWHVPWPEIVMSGERIHE